MGAISKAGSGWTTKCFTAYASARFITFAGTITPAAAASVLPLS